MIRRRTAAIAAGAVLLIGGLAAGCSTADADDTRDQPSAGAPADGPKRGGMDTSELVTALAEGLGVEEAKARDAVDKAISEVMGERGDRPDRERPDGEKPSTPPSTAPSGTPSAQPSDAPSADSERDAKRAESLAKVIADELGADQAKVLEIVKQHLPEPPARGDRGPRDGNGRPDREDDTKGSEPSPQPSATR